MSAALTTRAPAKINLTLRVIRRREDGYHELESLVAFAGVGDPLSLTPGPDTGLELSGPFGCRLSPTPDNLVLRAERALRDEVPSLRSGTFHLVKRLPVASGIGGGSADAAAALRLLARLNDLPLDSPALHTAAIRIGADVPVCLQSRARVMRGIGETLGAPLRLPRLFAVLANPSVPVETAGVFRSLGLAEGQLHRPEAADDSQDWTAPATASQLIASLASAGNDLEEPALRVAPSIAQALERLVAAPGCRLARMSGSGATCFALFDDCGQSARAAKALQKVRPDWWVRPTLLR